MRNQPLTPPKDTMALIGMFLIGAATGMLATLICVIIINNAK